MEKLSDLLEEVRAQLGQDAEIFEERRQQAYRDRQGYLVERYEKTINTLTGRDLLGYLANRNVLPNYGFPVDTVELRTSYSSDSAGRKLDLTRDLSAAIYEYAPGAQVVAGGLLWRSGGVYRLPNRELLGKHIRLYAVPALLGGRRGHRPSLPFLRHLRPFTRRRGDTRSHLAGAKRRDPERPLRLSRPTDRAFRGADRGRIPHL